MFKAYSLTKAIVGAKWMSDGLICNVNGTLSRALCAEPFESGRLEIDLVGAGSDTFFSKLQDLFSRLPDAFEGQIILQRRARGAEGNYSTLYFFEQIANENAYSHFAGLAAEAGLNAARLSRRGWEDLLATIFGGPQGSHELPDLVWQRGRVARGDSEIQAVSLTELPQVTWNGCFQDIFEKVGEFTFSMRIRVPPRGKTRKQLEAKRRINHSLSIASSLELRNIESNSVLSSAEETLERVLVGKEVLAETSIALLFSSPTETAKGFAREFVGLGAGLGNAGLYREDLGVLPVFKSHIPGNEWLKIRTLPVLTGNLAHLVPFLLDYSRAHEPSSLNVRARSGEQSHLNLFSKTNLNFNGVICGASGAGKSFLMNSLASSLLLDEPKTKLCIFDVGGSYRKLISNSGGVSKVLTPAEATGLLAYYFRTEKVQNNGLFRSLIEVLCGEGEHVTHSHRVAIGELLQSAAGSDLKISWLVKEARQRRERYYQDLAHWLNPYCQLDELNDDAELVNLGRMKIAAFDFKELANDPVLERTTVLVLSALIWRDLQAGTNPKTLIVFDEVWRFFKGVKDFIEEMYRTFRKYSAGIVSISQNAADYGHDEFSRMVFSNSYTKIFLEGGAGGSLLSDGLDLSSSDVARALSVSSKKPIYSEFFVSSGPMSQIMRLYPTEEFYKLANTERMSS